MNSLLRPQSIFPNISIKEYGSPSTYNKLELKTYIRIKRDSGWLLVHLSKEYMNVLLGINNMSRYNCINNFLQECYRAVILWKDNPNITDLYGKPIQDLDEFQGSEEERLSRYKLE